MYVCCRYQGFLEPWQEGTLTDPSSLERKKMDCSKTIWICTTNLGQTEILDFARRHKQRLAQKFKDRDQQRAQMQVSRLPPHTEVSMAYPSGSALASICEACTPDSAPALHKHIHTHIHTYTHTHTYTHAFSCDKFQIPPLLFRRSIV